MIFLSPQDLDYLHIPVRSLNKVCVLCTKISVSYLFQVGSNQIIHDFSVEANFKFQKNF